LNTVILNIHVFFCADDNICKQLQEIEKMKSPNAIPTLTVIAGSTPIPKAGVAVDRASSGSVRDYAAAYTAYAAKVSELDANYKMFRAALDGAYHAERAKAAKTFLGK
jgi:hypothetical protein